MSPGFEAGRGIARRSLREDPCQGAQLEHDRVARLRDPKEVARSEVSEAYGESIRIDPPLGLSKVAPAIGERFPERFDVSDHPDAKGVRAHRYFCRRPLSHDAR